MDSERSLVIGSRAMMPLLILQFLLGMFANLFISTPTGAGNQLVIIFTSGSIALILHVIVAALLLGLSVALVVISALARRRRATVLSLLGLVFMALAFFAGIAFVLGGYSDNSLSYGMAVGFILSFVVYGALAGQGFRTSVKQEGDR